tara:strand:+ start:303 stop:680 length:378 start_codon:yes stop_codon:yes gene_type:complete
MKTENINWKFISVLNLIVIIYLSFFILPGSDEIPPIIPHLDKIGHFILYGFQALSLFMLLKQHNFIKPNIVVTITCFIIGTIIEYLQPVLTSNRVFDFFDIIANLTGVLTSLIVIKLILLKKVKR